MNTEDIKELGKRYRCKVTGFTGICTEVRFRLYGEPEMQVEATRANKDDFDFCKTLPYRQWQSVEE